MKESKTSIFVRKYEMFKMEEDKSVEDMFGRFQKLINTLRDFETNTLRMYILKLKERF
jgi:hypothetical protein